MKKIDIVARLLATENLTIVRGNGRTATFDVLKRILTIPTLKTGTSDVIEDMMVCHETGHAKHSSWKTLEEANKTPPLSHYLNVVEDVRIEKLMKREYPGIRKSLADGYKELNDRDFFGVKSSGKKLDEFNLIDRINLYFKVGHNCGIVFTKKEFKFVERAEKLETEAQTLKLARDIFKFAKEQIQQQQQEEQDQKSGKTKGKGSGEKNKDEKSEGEPGEDDDNEDGDGSGDGEDGEDDGQSDGASTGKEGSKDVIGVITPEMARKLKSNTQEVFDQKFRDLAHHAEVHSFFSINPQYKKSPIVPFKQVLHDTSTLSSKVTAVNSSISDYKQNAKLGINFLIKEFEMKKSAEAHKRILQAKTGSLDVGKLYSYRLQDDLFKRISIIPKGKNHGMIFLLDWSSSMTGGIRHVVRQVLDLATFCKRMQIPFEVYAFTTYYRHRTSGSNLLTPSKTRSGPREPEPGTKFIPNNEDQFHLLQFLSSEMTTNEFNTMVDRLLTDAIYSVSGYSLGGTPLNEALMFFTGYVGEFKAKYGLEKTTFVSLTDGEGMPISVPAFDKGFIADPITKKNYILGTSGTTQTHTFLNIIRDRWDATTIGFHVMDDVSDLRTCIQNFSTKYTQADIDNYKQEIEKNGVVVVPSQSRDAMFITVGSKLVQKSSSLIVGSGSSAEDIAKSLGKNMIARKLNRIVLERFISTIA